MTRFRFALTATFSMVAMAGMAGMAGMMGLTATPAGAQTTRPRLVAPVRGEAHIGTLKPDTKVVGNEVVTTIQVKNLSAAPVAGFRVEEFWYDKTNNLVPGSREIVRAPIQPGEVITVTLHTPKDTRMSRNTYRFSHANGSVKADLMKSFDEAKQ
jgi:hypothetical protein